MAKRFDEIEPKLSENVLEVISSMGFGVTTPVQSAVIPLFLGNKDVAAEACTGSGKTLAFVIPIVEKLQQLAKPLKRHEVGALILSPTRELARQIYGVVKLFTDATESLHPALLVGGTDVSHDLIKCARDGCNIIIATPGRLLDIVNRSASGEDVDFKTLEVLVMDEADTLLDMGFADTITDILSKLPKQRRTGLFSATQTSEVAALARAGLRNPAVVSVKVQFKAGKDGARGDGSETQSTPASLNNWFTICDDSIQKLVELILFLRERAEKKEKAIVFVLTCASVDYYGRILDLSSIREAAGLPSQKDFPILPLHGQMAPTKRTYNYATFSKAPTGVLLCTDVAARGIDVPDVDWILQYDPPKDPSFYVHRAGRTARAGRKGSAKLFLLPKESGYVQLLGVRNVPIKEAAPMAKEGTYDESAVSKLLHTMKLQAVDDRDILEKGTKAFISFIRGYSEHICRYVFKLKHLDVPSLAASFGLVKLPKVDELRGQDIPYEGLEVDTSTIKYRDPKREENRQARLVSDAEKMAAEREARDARRDKAIAAAEAGKEAKRKRTHKGFQKKLFEDWEILQREERLEKRLKQGKITKKEYRKAMDNLHKEMGITEDDGIVEFAAEEAHNIAEAGPAAKRARTAANESNDDSGDSDSNIAERKARGGAGDMASDDEDDE